MAKGRRWRDPHDRFAPIADQSMAIWKILRQRSNVELGRIELEGQRGATQGHARRHGRWRARAALGVMSQGGFMLWR